MDFARVRIFRKVDNDGDALVDCVLKTVICVDHKDGIVQLPCLVQVFINFFHVTIEAEDCVQVAVFVPTISI